MAMTNLFLYFLIAGTYVVINHDSHARIAGLCFILWLSIMVGWWTRALLTMEHICTTFYTIKYPALQTAKEVCGVVNSILLVLFFLRECNLCFQKEDDDLED